MALTLMAGCRSCFGCGNLRGNWPTPANLPWRVKHGSGFQTKFSEDWTGGGGVGRRGSLPLEAAGGKATDWVTLGKSGVKVTRLAFGTGTLGGQVQRDLGQDGVYAAGAAMHTTAGFGFSRPAESYGEMQRMLGVALKGIPRDSYRMMSKVTTWDDGDPLEKIRRTAQSWRIRNTSTLCCCTGSTRRLGQRIRGGGRMEFWKRSRRRSIVSHGASVHGLPALRRVPENKWLDIAMIRMNHKGTRMDAEDYNTDGPGNVPEVVTHVKEARRAGHGRDQHEAGGRGDV